MLVDAGRLIRNNSGEFACPNEKCWRKHQTGIKPPAEVCPRCGVSIEWSEDAFDRSRYV